MMLKEKNEQTAISGTAFLSNKKDIISFSYQDKEIRFRGPYSLIRIEKVKEWDNGYIVVDARYQHSQQLVEDYIDLAPILTNLYVDLEAFLKPIKRVEVRHA